MKLTKSFRGKKICFCPDNNRLGFSVTLKQQIIHKEQYLKKTAHKYFYLKNPDGDEYIMGLFNPGKLIVTLAHCNKKTGLWTMNI